MLFPRSSGELEQGQLTGGVLTIDAVTHQECAWPAKCDNPIRARAVFAVGVAFGPGQALHKNLLLGVLHKENPDIKSQECPLLTVEKPQQQQQQHKQEEQEEEGEDEKKIQRAFELAWRRAQRGTGLIALQRSQTQQATQKGIKKKKGVLTVTTPSTTRRRQEEENKLKIKKPGRSRRTENLNLNLLLPPVVRKRKLMRPKSVRSESAKLGRRETMEDESYSGQLGKWEIHAIFDGHGGTRTSKLLREQLCPMILDQLRVSQFSELTNPSAVRNLLLRMFKKQEAYLHQDWLQTIPLQLDRLKLTGVHNPDETKIKTSPAKKQKQPARLPGDGGDPSGSCAIVVLRCSDQLFICNLGDSRCLVFDVHTVKNETSPHKAAGSTSTTGSTALQPQPGTPRAFLLLETEDHKPELKTERQRIERCGGFVQLADNAHRVNGILATARAFGDFGHQLVSNPNSSVSYASAATQSIVTSLKMEKDSLALASCPGVSAVPTVVHMVLQTDRVIYALLACDGIFDVLSNREVVGFLQDKVTDTQACSALTDLAFQRGSGDNLSALLLAFG